MTEQAFQSESEITDVDVLIVGAGISGIDAGYHLRKLRPGTSFAILEAQEAIGGTWHTHKFPGIRSDSDLFTFGFSWKPWTGVPIATAPEILSYLNEALEEQDLRKAIRFNHRIEAAEWSTETKRWLIHVRSGDGSLVQYSCGFLWMCAGYFNHSEGFTPVWDGMDDFTGRIVHPQGWPEDLDHAEKDVVVIGSGATAATIVPAMAKDAAHVTMLQRSPTYYYARPLMDDFHKTLAALDLPDEWYHEIMRRKFLHESGTTAKRSREEPDALAADLIAGAREGLGEEFDIKTHFTPTYPPWRQRIALIPDGDLFDTIRNGQASVVTDTIDQFTKNGVRLASGHEIKADIIVTATGLNLTMFGGIALSVDGVRVDPASCCTHRGTMFTGLPNFATVFGYLRSSWTLRADLISTYVCRLLDHMDQKAVHSVVPRWRAEDQNMEMRPWLDPANFNPGYILRSLHALPRQGDCQPWIMTQDYYQDRADLPASDFDDGTLQFQ